MPSWLVGTWSTLSARIRWLVLVATLPAVLLAVYQARSHRMDAIAAAENQAWARCGPWQPASSA
jgi:hypothetical protein